MALHYFHETAAIDLVDPHVAIDGGVHIADLADRSVRFCCAESALRLYRNRSTLAGELAKPRLCRSVAGLPFEDQDRPGRKLIDVTLQTGEPMTFVVSGERHELRSDRALRILTGRPSETI